MCCRSRLGLIAGFALALAPTLAPTLAGSMPLQTAHVAEVAGTYHWTMDDPNFGGLSGFDLYPDGRRFRAVTDRGYTVTGALMRDTAGQVTDAQLVRLQPLRDAAGHPVSGYDVDAEGLALGPGESFYVSFELEHRVVLYPEANRPAALYSGPIARDLSTLYINEGIEALALDDAGDLYAVTERSLAPGTGLYPVLRFQNGQWTIPFHIRQDGNWKVVSADFGPDGRFYVLERDFWGFVGFKSRIRRFAIDGDSIGQEQVLFSSLAGQFENLEGIAAWRGPDGAVWLTAVSDDNFSPLQKTTLVDFRVKE